jgi:hypothetical protein
MPRRLVISAVLLLGLLAFAPAAPVPKHLMPKDPPLTFPTTVGTKWVYELPNGSEQTIVISEVKEEKDGAKVVTMEGTCLAPLSASGAVEQRLMW